MDYIIAKFIESKMWNLVQRSGVKEMLPQESCFESKISCFPERISHDDVIMRKTWFSQASIGLKMLGEV